MNSGTCEPANPRTCAYLPILDYDFGAAFDPNDMRGAIVTPPTVRRVVTPLVPQVARDGNELAGIKSPLVANPLGTYLGWNVTASGFERGRQCAFSGVREPFLRQEDADRIVADAARTNALVPRSTSTEATPQ